VVGIFQENGKLSAQEFQLLIQNEPEKHILKCEGKKKIPKTTNQKPMQKRSFGPFLRFFKQKR
jgi:hypothetical protein